MRVIAVDDEKPSLMRIERMLREIPGVEFAGAYKYAAEALAHQEQDAPDLAFLDVEMPEMDGLVLCERLMEQNPRIEIIFVTAYEKYALKAYQTNAIGYLLKPVQAEEVAAQIERLNRRYGKAASLGAKPYFQTFGPFLVKADRASADLFRFRTEKSEELLAFLLSRGAKPVPRDTLCEALWGDMEADRATRNFHTTAYNIRRTFGEAGLNDLLMRVHESYLLNAQRYECDLSVFCAAAEQCEKGACPLEECEKAVGAYEGPFLADKGYSWLSEYQTLFERQFEQMSLRLIDARLAQKQLAQAEAHARKLLRLCPFSEQACERLVHVCREAGRREEAARILASFQKRFCDEMGVEPSVKV